MKLLIIVLSLIPSAAWTWGGRGHYTICDAAVFLVKEKGLKEFLQNKPQILGHLCNIPDTHWRNLGPEISKQGGPTHYIDGDIFDISIAEIPLDYKTIVTSYTGKKSAYNDVVMSSIPSIFGSNWWRADQFYRRAISLGPDWKKSPPPTNAKEEQSSALAFNKYTAEFYTNLGLMGHFVGDNGQPFHLTADYDGYKAGHGGIHAYYEDTIVGSLPYNLTSKVVEAGQKLQKLAESKKKSDRKEIRFLFETSVLSKMKALGEVSFSEIEKIYKLDPVLNKSSQKDEKGMTLKTPAQRAPAETVSKKIEPLIVNQLARSATLLAQLWDEAYAEVGRPKLASYKSYDYPFTPDFVPPDYFDLKLLDKKE